MKIDDIVKNIVSSFDSQNNSFNENKKLYIIDEKNNKYAVICNKTFKIIEDNLDIQLRQVLSDELNKAIFNKKIEKTVSEYRCLYTYLENTNRLEWKIEKRECPDFRIYNEDLEEYIEVTQDITQYESIAVKCLNRFYYGDKHIDKSLKKYLNIKRVNRDIIVSPKYNMNSKKRRENLFCIICRKIDKYTKYINEQPSIIDGTKTILAKMRTPIDIIEPDIIGVITKINMLIDNTIVEKVVLITCDNNVIIINRK